MRLTGWWSLRRAGAVVALAAVYVGLLVFYALDDQSGLLGAPKSVESPSHGVLVAVTARSIDAAAQVLTVGVTIEPDPELLDEQAAPRQTISVFLAGTNDGAPVTFPAGQEVGTRQAQLFADGRVHNWPFDHYAVLVVATATAGPSATDLPVTLQLAGALQGWDLSADVAPGLTPKTENGADLGGLATLHLRRSLGILLFGCALVAVLIMLPALGLYVAVRVYRGQQKMEPAFLSWIAGMLFAAIPLRTFLPGTPPPGSWIDVAVVLWVIVALTVAFFLIVLAWARQGSREAPTVDESAGSASSAD